MTCADCRGYAFKRLCGVGGKGGYGFEHHRKSSVFSIGEHVPAPKRLFGKEVDRNRSVAVINGVYAVHQFGRNIRGRKIAPFCVGKGYGKYFSVYLSHKIGKICAVHYKFFVIFSDFALRMQNAVCNIGRPGNYIKMRSLAVTTACKGIPAVFGNFRNVIHTAGAQGGKVISVFGRSFFRAGKFAVCPNGNFGIFADKIDVFGTFIACVFAAV